MNPAIPVTIPAPDPLPLPAPGWLLWTLLMLTFFLHLVPMNLVLGGSILAAAERWRGRAGDPHAATAARLLGRFLPFAIPAAVTFGVAPLLFAQVLYGRLFFVSSVLMAWFWLSVIGLLIAGYFGAYAVALREAAGRPAPPAVPWAIAFLFMSIAFIYTNNTSLMLRADAFAAKYAADPRGWNLNLDDPTVPFRYAHILLGSIAVAGMATAVLGLLRRRRDAAFGAWAVRRGTLWFAIPTALNIVVGVIWLMALPRAWLRPILGGSATATALLVAGVLLAITTLIVMMRALEGDEPARAVRAGTASLVLTLIAMILIRDQVRRAALESAGFEAAPWVAPQWGVIAIFAVLLAIALGSVAWMVAAIAKGRPAGA